MQISERLLALAFAGLLSLPAGVAGAQSTGGAFAFESAGADIVRHRETGLVNWMSSVSAEPLARAAGSMRAASFTAAAGAFLNSQAPAFGLDAPGVSLSALGARGDGLGRSFARFQQRYRGVPIIGAELNVQLDGARNVVSVNGESVGDLNLSTEPDVAPGDAVSIAVRSTARAHAVEESSLTPSAPSLAIHDPRIMGGPPARPRLVWKVEVENQSVPKIRELVLVDAENGRVAVQFNEQPHAAPPANAKQRVCDANNTSAKYPCTTAGDEDDPGSSAVTDVKNAFDYAENTYDFFARRFNRDSLDNKGLRLVSTVRLCPAGQSCPYANAFWDGKQMAYGQGFAAADDVVGHELTHGVTDFSSHLYYWYQSGAINEALSDIFGEFIDQTNSGGTDTPEVKWLMGEDVPGFGAIRDMENPPAFNDPDKMTSGLYWTSSSDSGGVHTNSGVANKATFLMTEPGDNVFNGQTVKGIGIDKSAAIWYRVNNFLLTSSSDFADLGNALNRACSDLTGTTPKKGNGKPSPDGKIVKANCTQVSNAVTATEMFLQPPGNAIAPEAPLCSGNRVPKNVVFEKFEGAKNKFKFKYPNGDIWSLWDEYASSNRHAVDAYDYESPLDAHDTSLTQVAGVKIPQKAFLHFHQYRSFRTSSGTFYTGAVVEYKIGNGPWKRVTPGMFTHNSYNGTVQSNPSFPNALSGEQAFVGFSAGWTSSRIDLATLAGKTVKFRFRVATSNLWDGVWWDLDDIRIYTCVMPKKVAALQ